MAENERINCMKCTYFYITWDPNAPKGCKAFGFKSKSMPSVTVLSSSGKPCMHYKAKQQV